MDQRENTTFSTRICFEQPNSINPFVAQQRLLHGYNLVDLWRQRSFSEVLLLLFTGELPGAQQCRFFEQLMIGLCHPGPRHPAVRAAMLAGVSKTGAEHLLPIALLTGSGAVGGALEVETAYEFLHEHQTHDATACALDCIARWDAAGDMHRHITPGFGQSYGAPDPIWQALAEDLSTTWPESPVLLWCAAFVRTLETAHCSWLAPGLVAAAGLALNLGARESMGLYQLLIAPGVLAQGMEQTHQPISSNSLLADQYYERTDPHA